MKEIYSNLDLHFMIENVQFHALNITSSPFLIKVPAHSHSNESYEIHYISEGYGTAGINGNTYELVPGTIFVTGPHVEHSQVPSVSEPMRECCIYLRTESVKKQVDIAGADPVTALFKETPFWLGKDSETIPFLMEHLFYELEHQYIGYKENVQALLIQLIVTLVRNYSKNNRALSNMTKEAVFQKTPLLIEDCFLFEYKTLTLKELAGRLGVSVRQTERYLKEYYGKTFIQKRTESRMAAALILLADSSRSITSISEELGYSSIEHFSAAFKKYYKCNATEYRKKRY